jgi:zinc protease
MFAVAVHRCGQSCVRGLRLRLALAFLFALAIAASAQVQAATPASHFVLGNGMEVVVVSDHRVPVVTHELWYKVGAAEDPEGQVGVAHFVEHMMFRGTKRFPDNAFDRFMVSIVGSRANAFTTHDYTRYPQSLPKQKLAELMELEADRMVNLEIRDEDARPEIGAVLNERRGKENSPAFLFYERLAAARFPDHPYGRSVLGSAADIKTLDRAKALAFYNRHYAPNNAILVVAGDVTESEVRALAEKTYGRVPARAVPKRVVSPLPAAPRTWRVELEHEQVTHPSVGFYYMTPGTVATPGADAAALNVLSHIAGQFLIGRLHRRLVTEKRLAMSVSASYGYDIQSGTLAFTAQAAPGVPIADVERALAAEIALLGRDGVTREEVDDAKRAYKAAQAYDEDNHRTRAYTYGLARIRGLSIADVDAMDHLIAKVTAVDINRLATRILAKSRPVIGVMRPLAVRAEAPASGRPATAR